MPAENLDDLDHGPHLYLTYQSEGKNRALYVPAEQAEEARRAHAAWKQFWEVGCAIAAHNRERLRERMQGPKPTRKGPSSPSLRYWPFTAML